MHIPLSTFVDFVSKAGSPKLTVVKNAKKQLAQDYNPATDFYKQIREKIIEFHKSQKSKSWLDNVTKTTEDKKKLTAYPPIIAGYKQFLGSQNVTWFAPPKKNWSHGKLTVNVNPELGLLIDGYHHIIKLYFKSDKLAKLRIDIVTQLMQSALSAKAQKKIHYCVLDVRNGKLFKSSQPNTGMLALLKGEASSFAEVFGSI